MNGSLEIAVVIFAAALFIVLVLLVITIWLATNFAKARDERENINESIKNVADGLAEIDETVNGLKETVSGLEEELKKTCKMINEKITLMSL